jgi:hypothetical protein
VVTGLHVRRQPVEARHAEDLAEDRRRALLVVAVDARLEPREHVRERRVDDRFEVRRARLRREVLDRAHGELEVARPEERTHDERQHVARHRRVAEHVEQHLRVLQRLGDAVAFAAAVERAQHAEQGPPPQTGIARGLGQLHAEQRARVAEQERGPPLRRCHLPVVEHLLAHGFGLLLVLLGGMDLLQQETVERAFPGHRVLRSPYRPGVHDPARDRRAALATARPP